MNRNSLVTIGAMVCASLGTLVAVQLPEPDYYQENPWRKTCLRIHGHDNFLAFPQRSWEGGQWTWSTLEECKSRGFKIIDWSPTADTHRPT